MTDLLDNILSFITQREAEQIQYGLYDVFLTGAEIFDAFPARENETHDALTELWQRGLIIRFEDETIPREWLFRSRTAETVRLVSKLRQRVVDSRRAQKRHRADRSPRLVHDLKYETRRRQVPERDIPISSLISALQHSQKQDLIQAATWLESLFPSPTFEFSGFQARSFTNIVDHILLNSQRSDTRGLVVTASTGAGKTYAFFLPVLTYCLVHKGQHGRSGVKAICLYPRLALAENQLEDFVRLVYQANQLLPPEKLITIGIDSGASPYKLEVFAEPNHDRLQNMRGWQWNAAEDHYICPFAQCPKCDSDLAVSRMQTDRIVCIECDTAHPFILYAKKQFTDTPPDILVATTESLNMRLMDSKYQMLFGDDEHPPPAVVMLDEIHLQSSTKGTQIALLLRRLKARIRLAAQKSTSSQNLMVIGLSATIARPKSFFTDLTGLPPSAIIVVKPETEEMQERGAEHYLFVRAEQEEDTAVISTLLQTAMAVVHGMPQPSPEEQGEGIFKYKTFGFAQSLDIVGRWLYQLQDAEKMKEDDRQARQGIPPERWPIERIPLYRYRYPGESQRLFPNFFGRGVQVECNCHETGHPNPNCLYFQEGECWWTLPQGLADPMRIKRKTASDRQTQIKAEDDLIITTSALEVGYDDASIMGVIQYQAPSNVASFVQRKGRGGRKVGSRPLVTTVLSPYKTADVFLYQNHHLLVDPRFKKLPLNPANIFLQRIHGFYALFDWLAYQAARQNLLLNLTSVGNYEYEALRHLTGQPEMLDAAVEYLQQVFNLRNPTRLQMLLVDPDAPSWNDNGILSYGLRTVMDTLHKSLDQGNKSYIKIRQVVLRDYLPQNLFSDINLPELNVDYGHQLKAEDIALGLAETMPGNVTFRGGGGSSWIAPPLGEGEVFLLESNYTLSDERRHETPLKMKDVPRRVTQLMEAMGRRRAFSMIRPTGVQMERFGNRDGAQWWLDRAEEPGRLFQVPPNKPEPRGQTIRQVRHSSGAYPVGFTKVERPNMVGRRFSFDARDDGPLFNDLGRATFQRIDFASDADNGRLLKVRRVIVGSQYSLKVVGEDDPIEGVVTFARRQSPTELTAIGYEMETEGITFKLAELQPERWQISTETTARLQRNFVKHAFVTELSAQNDVNYFAASRFADVMLTLTDLLRVRNGWKLPKIKQACRQDNEKFEKQFNAIAERVYHLSQKNTRAVQALFARQDVRTRFAEHYEEIHNKGRLYYRYLEDTFVHTLKHALKQTAQTLAGVEAMQYVSAYAPLNMDFGEVRDRPIWLYELGLGGVGVLRSVQEELRQHPAHFWRLLEASIVDCETEAEDQFLFNVLSQPEETLHNLHTLTSKVRTATGSNQRETALNGLRQAMQAINGLWPSRIQIRLLLRLFSDDYLGQGIGLRNWKLHREINTYWLPHLSESLGRLPTATEARGLLHRALKHPNGQQRKKERAAYPELTRLLSLYEEEYGNDDEMRRIFENAISRRLLLNCRDACPTCLDEGPACQIDAPGLSGLTLSRSLVAEVWSTIRRSRRVACTTATPAAELSQKVEELFQQDTISPVILTTPLGQWDTISTLISHLTDHGIRERLERRYPRVERVRAVDDDLHVWLTLEKSK